MKTKLVEVREGEDVGPIDWSHPMAFELKEEARKCCGTPDMALYDVLTDAEKRPERWLLTTDGGIPRCGFHQVIAVRMYDGHPYWKPTPSVLLQGVLGPYWTCFSMLNDARRVSMTR